MPGRARRHVIVVDAGGPRNAPAAHAGVLSRGGTPPSELLDLGRAEILHYGNGIVTDRVVDALPRFTLRVADEERATLEPAASRWSTAPLNVNLSDWPAPMPTVVRTFVPATIAVPIVIYGLMLHLHRARGHLLTRGR